MDGLVLTRESVKSICNMDKFAQPAVDSLRPPHDSCMSSLRSTRLRRMNIDKSAGWRPWLSYGQGKTFWHNEATGETSWVKPKGAHELPALQLKPLKEEPIKAETPVDYASFERPDSVSARSDRSSQIKPHTAAEAGPSTASGRPASRPVLPRSCYRRQTFNRLRQIAELAPADRPPPLQPLTSREQPKQPPTRTLQASGAHTHRDSKKTLSSYLDSMVEREAGKWQNIHHSIKVKEARSHEAYWTRLDEVHT